MPAPRANVLLELHAASAVFLRGRGVGGEKHRERLRHAIVAIIRDRGAVLPSELVATQSEALDVLRSIIVRCQRLRVPWTEVVAIVNRDWAELPGAGTGAKQ